MSAPDIEALLRDAMGLDASSLGPSAVTRAVQQRQRASGLDDIHAYYLRASADPAERQALVEAVVVPETWFFRDREAFTVLADVARVMLADDPQRTLRLLSLPCSSGEEPYSMAIALLEAGVDPKRFRIDAVDISHAAIDAARLALYGQNSFRSAELGFRDRHFRGGDGRWQPSDVVRDCVGFLQGNLFAPDLLPGSGQYDLVFCRNVLIYFSIDLLRLLGPDGALFVGPSETGLLPRQKLASAQRSMAFAFRRLMPAVLGQPAARAAARMAPAAPGAASRAASHAARRPALDSAPPRLSGSDVRSLSLSTSQALADQGRLAEAAAACEQYLRESGGSADAYCLLGLIRDAAGDKAAAAMLFRKALYLEPRHGESLAHLALLLERQGDAHGAHLLRKRLRRLDDADAAS